jgi:hypothetical protein
MKKKYRMVKSLIAFYATKPILLRTPKQAQVNSFVKGQWEPAPNVINLTREKFRRSSNIRVKKSSSA